ncbi:MAG: hypothetical protein IPN66_06205 [Candidatus Competibacteraceae bacterium]|jgi:hypothetical protein|nr:hypothetical protein [Candidatus Competibacteraceae bacterium]MBK8896809.1 hypothetical protein [Candidatus Competibacteraceae bacterium]
MDFQKWFNEADMPEVVNGEWVDLETGIAFSEWNAPAKKRERKPPTLEINGRPATAAAGLEYAKRLVKGQAVGIERARDREQTPAVTAYILAAEAAISAIGALTDGSKKVDIAAAIRLNQAASREANATRK